MPARVSSLCVVALLCPVVVISLGCGGSAGLGTEPKAPATDTATSEHSGTTKPPPPRAAEPPPRAAEPPPLEVTVLAKPPFAFTPPTGKPAPPLRLRRTKSAKNQVTDSDAWFENNAIALPTVETAAGTPSEFRGTPFQRAIPGDSHDLYLYQEFGGPRQYIIAQPKDQASYAPAFVFDLSRYRRAPTSKVGFESLTAMDLTWAEIHSGVLYVSHSHRTYAESSGGKNAFITALDVPSGQLKWMSRTLMSNSRNFVLYGDYIVTGYGFTQEPDFLYVLDRATGTTLNKTKLKTGPDYFIVRDKTLYVRTYNMDYEFKLP